MVRNSGEQSRPRTLSQVRILFGEIVPDSGLASRSGIFSLGPTES
jgi:hypothetical protein